MRTKPSPLSLTVQQATDEPGLPSRRQLRAWAQAALERPAQVTVRLVGEAEGRRLNREFRGKDYPTNVLTFVYQDGATLAGDIVLCAPVVSAEARTQGKTTEAHYAHLVVHAILHLQGYEHEQDEQAEAMESRETEIVTRLGYPAPYATNV